MSIKKQFLKSKPVCKVTFRVLSSEVEGAKEVKLLGCFNNWDKSVVPMKSLKNGDFTTTIELASNEDFEFRYLVDNTYWVNDAESEALVPNSFGETNSFVSTKA